MFCIVFLMRGNETSETSSYLSHLFLIGKVLNMNCRYKSYICRISFIIFYLFGDPNKISRDPPVGPDPVFGKDWFRECKDCFETMSQNYFAKPKKVMCTTSMHLNVNACPRPLQRIWDPPPSFHKIGAPIWHFAYRSPKKLETALL